MTAHRPDAIDEVADALASAMVERLSRFRDQPRTDETFDVVREDLTLFLYERFPSAPARRIGRAVEVHVQFDPAAHTLTIDFEGVAADILDPQLSLPFGGPGR